MSAQQVTHPKPTVRITHPGPTVAKVGRLAVAAALLFAGTLAFAPAVSAQDLVVTTTADGGTGSLRAALDVANASGDADVIVLGAGAEYVLSNCAAGELISSNGALTIVGNGATIRQSCADQRVLRNTSSDLLTVDNTTLTGGDGPTDGGAILSTAGPVAILGSTIAGNRAAGDGGGVFVDGQALRIDRSSIRDNTAFDYGGGIGVFGELQMTQSVVEGNSVTGAGAYGGGIYVLSGATGARVSGSIVRNNHADGAGGLGGGIYVDTGSLGIDTTTVANNTAAGDGAGVYAYFDTTITRSTVSGNTAGGRGGGVFSYDPDLEVRDSTVVANNAVAGAGVLAEGFGLTMSFVTVNGNSSTGGAQIDLGGGTLRAFASVLAGAVGGPNCAAVVPVSEGYNYEPASDSCGLRTATDVVAGASAELGTLADNGGPTQTEAPGATSPLRDAISAEVAGCSGADQRGVTRPQGGACDIGAVEQAAVLTQQPGAPLAFVG
jgi:hypothetical protein